MPIEIPSDIVWIPAYELGYPLIDGEHRYLVELVGRASGAIDSHDTAEALALTNRLVAACQYHFKHEEELMREIGFEQIDRHVEYHRRLLFLAYELAERCESANDMRALRESFDAVTRCLLHDVIAGDKEFLPYLEARGLR